MAENILGIDYGSKKIGLAIAQKNSTVALIFGILQNDSKLWHTLTKIISNEHVGIAVIGMPYNMKGDYTEQTMLVQKFYTDFKAAYPPLKVFLEDERYTTKIASRHAKGKNDDSAAAVLILQGFLERNAL
jgi:putative Holliday junction resolvase